MYVDNHTPDEMDLSLCKKGIWINQNKRGPWGDKTFAANEKNQNMVKNLAKRLSNQELTELAVSLAEYVEVAE